jgi:hypothetical protein
MTADDHTAEAKAKLKALRDRLALEAPRARARSNIPPDLGSRLAMVLDRVSGAYLMLASKGASEEALDGMVEDVLVEAHLALHELERYAEVSPPLTPKPRLSGVERRVHPRHDTDVKVQLLRFNIKNDGLPGAALEAETIKRPARNVSLGGIFVAIARDELPQVTVGGVVHVSVSAGEATSFKARAVVMRRDPSGIGLSWLEDTDRLRKDVEVLLNVLRRR